MLQKRFIKMIVGSGLLLLTGFMTYVWEIRDLENMAKTLGSWENFGVHLGFTVLGSIGSYIWGQLLGEDRARIYARDSYRRLTSWQKNLEELRHLFLTIESGSSHLIELNPKTLADSYIKAGRFLIGKVSTCLDDISNSLELCNDLAQEEVKEFRE